MVCLAEECSAARNSPFAAGIVMVLDFSASEDVAIEESSGCLCWCCLSRC